MRQLLVSLLTIVFFQINAQISVEKIWKKYEYYGSQVAGFRSMNDGEYFSKISELKAGTGVTKHRFDDYQGNGEVLIDPRWIETVQMDDYSFNADETKALITTKRRYITCSI